MTLSGSQIGRDGSREMGANFARRRGSGMHDDNWEPRLSHREEKCSACGEFVSIMSYACGFLCHPASAD